MGKKSSNSLGAISRLREHACQQAANPLVQTPLPVCHGPLARALWIRFEGIQRLVGRNVRRQGQDAHARQWVVLAP